jgi:hypothetical protein
MRKPPPPKPAHPGFTVPDLEAAARLGGAMLDASAITEENADRFLNPPPTTAPSGKALRERRRRARRRAEKGR